MMNNQKQKISVSRYHKLLQEQSWHLLLFTTTSICICSNSMYGATTHQEKSQISMSLSEKMRSLNQEKKTSSSNSELEALQRVIIEKKTKLHELLAKTYVIINSVTQSTNNDPSSTPHEREQKLHELLQEDISQIQALRADIRHNEIEWKLLAQKRMEDENPSEESDGIWHQPDTTVGQLIIDYNISDVVYSMPLEISSMKVHLSSQIPVPKAVWNEMLDLILSQMGIGVKQVMPFVKQLYFLRVNQSGLYTITDDRILLDVTPDDAKVAFILSPPAGDLRRVFQFIDRFSPQEQIAVQVLGGQLVVVGLVREIRELLKVYDFITSPKRAQEYRLVSLEKGDSEEISKILLSIFEGDTAKGGSEGFSFPNDKAVNLMPMLSVSEPSFGFRVIPMKFPSSSLFLMGKAEQIEKAVQIIKDIETNIGEIQDKTIYWYACQHSEADELAKVLSQVYIKLLSSKGVMAPTQKNNIDVTGSIQVQRGKELKPSPAQLQMRQERATEYNIAHPQDSLIVPSQMISMSEQTHSSSGTLNENFIVDPKTNSIIMVVENYVLPKLKELVHKLDVPKRMVQIDVLMFEKRVSDSSSFGLNLLKTGSEASGKHKESVIWNEHSTTSHKKKHSKHDKEHNNGPALRGILQFAVSRAKSGSLPAYDLAYQFLLSQDDIQINANPSIVTVNQTPAKIAVVDQISINTGAVEYDRDHFKDAYQRAEYGITIQITPTVHSKVDQEDEPNAAKFVTLATEIIFDTTHPDKHDRPDVTRRNIKNEVRVRDGETVILGGLRKKHSTGSQDSIPFLGEIPGLGKFFSTTILSDTTTEMFIFITPKIIPDNREAEQKLRYEALQRRPGDIPEFFEAVEEARRLEKKAIFERSIKLILSPPIVSTQF